jgi:hypothetical protein
MHHNNNTTHSGDTYLGQIGQLGEGLLNLGPNLGELGVRQEGGPLILSALQDTVLQVDPAQQALGHVCQDLGSVHMK